MAVLKQSLIFDEALRDSPMFKTYLKGYEDRLEGFDRSVAKLSQASSDLSRIQSTMNNFKSNFTSSFNCMSQDLVADRVLKNAVDVVNDLIEAVCNGIYNTLQEMRDHVLETMVDIFKMHMQKIEDKKRQYYSRFDFFENTLVKGVTGSGTGLGSPFNDRGPSDSTVNSRIAFKHSALEVAKVFNIFRVEFREQILNSFPRLINSVNGLSQRLHEKTRQIRPDVEAVKALISRALLEYREEKEYVNHRYEVCRKRCASVSYVDDAHNISGGSSSSNNNSGMVIGPPLPYLTSCNIIILQGYLLKQPHTRFGPWSRRWFFLVDDRLLYYRTNEKLLSLAGKKESDFKIVTESLNKSWLIRAKKDDRKPNLLELQGPSDQNQTGGNSNSNKHVSLLLQAESRAESSLWQDVIFATIQNSSSKTAPKNSFTQNSSSNELVLVDTIIKPDFANTSTIEEVSRAEENKLCCDCSALDPSWGVTSFGITVCSSCAQVHRALVCSAQRSPVPVQSHQGLHRVLSLTLDEWRPEVAALMKLLGNRIVNSIYEACRTEELERPSFDSDMTTREKWIVGKYVEQRFVRALSDLTTFDPSQKLFSAVNSESCDVGLMLQYISQGADVNWRNPESDDMTPLHNATFGGKLTCCELLIQQGAGINATDNSGKTPLHYACLNSNRMLACLLLNHGADPHAVDSEEKTPMDLATDAQDRDLLCVLKISQALRKFQPLETDNSRFASNGISGEIRSRLITNPAIGNRFSPAKNTNPFR